MKSSRLETIEARRSKCWSTRERCWVSSVVRWIGRRVNSATDSYSIILISKNPAVAVKASWSDSYLVDHHSINPPPPPSISIKHSSLGKLGWSFFHFQINRKILREAFFFFFFFWKDQPWFFFFFLSFFHHWNRPRTLACIVIINDSYLPILPSVLHQDFLLLTLSFVSTLLSSPCPSSIPSSHFIPLRSSRKEPILIKIKLDKTPQRVPHQLWLIDSLRPPLPFTQFLIDPCVMLRSVPFDYPFDVTIF